MKKGSYAREKRYLEKESVVGSGEVTVYKNWWKYHELPKQAMLFCSTKGRID